MSADRRKEEKQRRLRQQATLNPRPEAVTHPLFRDSEFFDSNDLLQVKYEMLRVVSVEKRPVSESAKVFGFSRPSFYQAQAAFAQSGLAGLIPQKPGPRSGHKLTPTVPSLLSRPHGGERLLTPNAGGSFLLSRPHGGEPAGRSHERRPSLLSRPHGGERCLGGKASLRVLLSRPHGGELSSPRSRANC